MAKNVLTLKKCPHSGGLKRIEVLTMPQEPTHRHTHVHTSNNEVFPETRGEFRKVVSRYMNTNQAAPEDELQVAPVKGQTMENATKPELLFFHTRKVEAASSSFASHAAGLLLRLFVQNLFSLRT